MNSISMGYNFINLTRGVYVAENRGLFTTIKVKHKLNMYWHFPGAIFLFPLFLILNSMSGVGSMFVAMVNYKKGDKFLLEHESYWTGMKKRIKHNSITRNRQQGFFVTKTYEKNLDIRFLPSAVTKMLYMSGFSLFMAGFGTLCVTAPFVCIWACMYSFHMVAIAAGLGSLTYLSSFFFPMISRAAATMTVFLVAGFVTIFALAPEDDQFMYMMYLHHILDSAFRNR